MTTNSTAPKQKTINKLFAIQAVMFDPYFTTTDCKVLALLIEYTSGFNGYAWPSVETMATVMGCTGRAVQLSLRRLENAGLVLTLTGGGRAKSSRYRVLLDAVTEPPLRERIRAAAAQKVKTPSRFPDDRKPERVKSCAERAKSDDKKGEAQFTRTLLRNPSYKNPSANAGAACAAPSIESEDSSDAKVATTLRTLDKAVKHWREHGISPAERKKLPQYAEWLSEITTTWDYENPLRGWAYNLEQEIAAWTDH